MKLYSNAQSPSCKRVRTLANEIGLAVETIEMDFSKGDLQKPDYLAKNPMGKVPTLEDDGFTLWESPAMLVYLATKHNAQHLFPSDARQRAETLRWMFWNASHLETAVFRVAFEKLIKPFMNQKPDDNAIAEGRSWYDRFAPVLNGHLEGKTWIAGDSFTVADIAVATTAELGSSLDIGQDNYKHIGAWLARVQARPSWKKA